MQTPQAVRSIILHCTLLAWLSSGTAFGQSRGTGPSGAEGGYLSGSASTGHHGNSGSTETLHREPAPQTPGVNAAPASRSRSAATADQEIARRIRTELANDQGLAPYADSIHIDVSAGEVTLRGPVKTEKDKADIAGKAQQTAGVTVVHNQLQIAPNLGGTVSGSAASATQ
jgi:hyperosmotically inducible protein